MGPSGAAISGDGSSPYGVLDQKSRTDSRQHQIGSEWINQTRGLPSPFHWQACYAVFSVSQSNVEAVRHYIRQQPDHLTKQPFQDALREWLR